MKILEENLTDFMDKKYLCESINEGFYDEDIEDGSMPPHIEDEIYDMAEQYDIDLSINHVSAGDDTVVYRYHPEDGQYSKIREIAPLLKKMRFKFIDEMHVTREDGATVKEYYFKYYG